MKTLTASIALFLSLTVSTFACGVATPAPSPTPKVAAVAARTTTQAVPFVGVGVTNYIPVGPAMPQSFGSSCTGPSLTPYAQASNGFGYTTTTAGISANIPLGTGYRECMKAQRLALCVAYKNAGVLLSSPAIKRDCVGLDFAS